jgi:hypothetical protein
MKSLKPLSRRDACRKKIGACLGWTFLALSLVAVLGLAAADFSEIDEADRQATVKLERHPVRLGTFNKKYVPPTPLLVTPSRHQTKKIDTIPDCLQSI